MSIGVLRAKLDQRDWHNAGKGNEKYFSRFCSSFQVFRHFLAAKIFLFYHQIHWLVRYNKIVPWDFQNSFALILWML